MAKNLYSEQKLIKMVGTLSKNEDGEFICTVELKDSYREYNVLDILEQMIDTEISLSSVEEL